MSVTDVRTAAAIPAGWYPDPVAATGLRWWSGATWTEHTSMPTAPVVHVPVQQVPVEHAPVEQVPELSRFSRDPVVSGRAAGIPTAAELGRRKDPYRDRNVIGGIALGASLLGLFGFIAGQIFGLPDVIQYIVGGAPFSLAIVAVVIAIRTGRGMAVAVIAAVLCLVNVTMVAALGASEASADLGSLDPSQDQTSTFRPILEQSALEYANTLGLPGIAETAVCPDMPVPAMGTVTDCTVTLDNGDSYLVHITASDGLGGMSLELVDEPIPAENAASGG